MFPISQPSRPTVSSPARCLDLRASAQMFPGRKATRRKSTIPAANPDLTYPGTSPIRNEYSTESNRSYAAHKKVKPTSYGAA